MKSRIILMSPEDARAVAVTHAMVKTLNQQDSDKKNVDAKNAEAKKS